MSEQEEIKLFERLREKVRNTQKALFERKAKLGEPVVIADAEGMPLVVTAEEALRRLEQMAR